MQSLRGRSESFRGNYIAFACIAGWAYGYPYIKTRNVFYCAPVHTLVNSSVVIFGLEFMM